MNREIKFRGMRIDNGEWVYGYYVKNPKTKHRIYFQPFSEATSNTYYFVQESTVGQYTGIKDKNGVEIYEGDLFQVANNKIYKVRFIENLECNYEMIAATFALWFDEFIFFPFDEYAISHGKVIGNIHENPELIQ